MKLSIIVPVYNVEKYLRKCIDSILAQTFTDYELILVDDGSIDSCPAICDEYAKKDSRIKVIHKQNGGLSDARNAGLDIVQGDYIGFVDSDDYIDAKMYDVLYTLALQNNADIVSCNIRSVSEDNPSDIMTYSKGDSVKEYTGYEIINSFKTVRFYLSPSVCNKIFSKALFSNLRFPKGKIYEDEYVILDILDL